MLEDYTAIMCSIFSRFMMSKLENVGMYMCHEVAVLFTNCSIDEVCYEREPAILLVEVFLF